MEKIFDQVDVKTINELAEIVKSKELSEITIASGDSKIVIKGTKCVQPLAYATPIQGIPSVEAEKVEVAPTSQEISGQVVKAPIIGTYYATPAPDKDPFVKVGQEVKKGDVIMIIESMKLMNEVQSEFDGIVKEILIESGTPVEFDQPIMIIV